MLTQEVIVAIRALLNRVQLSGAEVPAYNKIMLALAAEENEHRIRDGGSREGGVLGAATDCTAGKAQ